MSKQRQQLVRVNIGRIGHPGSDASETVCEIQLISSGRYAAIGHHSTGSNQGYYRENYSYGPWEGRGDTAQEAVRAMVGRADSDYHDLMSKAGHDALIRLEDITS